MKSKTAFLKFLSLVFILGLLVLSCEKDAYNPDIEPTVEQIQDEGTIVTETFQGSLTQQEVKFKIYLPPGYDQNDQQY